MLFSVILATKLLVDMESMIFWVNIEQFPDSLTFWSSIAPPSSVSKSKSCKKQAKPGRKLSLSFLLDFLFDPEDGGATVLQNFGIFQIT
jgi:hypothetical protein